MNNQSRILLFSIVVFFSGCIAANVAAKESTKENVNYHTYTLENGLQVVIIPNSRAPVVYHSIWYKVGSADSPRNRTGLAHFLEHLMFKGSQKFPKDTFKRTINDLGGEQNANTTWDRTAYFVTIAKEHLPIVMEMEADRMHNLLLTEEDVDKERDVVLQERRSSSDAKPEARLSEAANATFFWEHPYGKPVIGFEEHIRQYKREDALKFYQTWYAPNNAILVIAGDVKIEELKPLIQKYYGTLKAKSDLPIRQRLSEPDHRGVNAKVEIRDPQVGGMFLQRMYPAPNFRTKGTHQEAILTLLQDILGDSTYGRLNQTLVENQKLAHFANANYTGYYYDPLYFTVTSAPMNSSDLQLLDASIEALIRRMISDGVTEQEVATAKEQWKFETLYRRDSLIGIANYFGENLANGYSLKDLDAWLTIIQKVTVAEVNQAAKDILGPGPRVTMIGYPVAQK
jgi:zinc protease